MVSRQGELPGRSHLPKTGGLPRTKILGRKQAEDQVYLCSPRMPLLPSRPEADAFRKCFCVGEFAGYRLTFGTLL